MRALPQTFRGDANLSQVWLAILTFPAARAKRLDLIAYVLDLDRGCLRDSRLRTKMHAHKSIARTADPSASRPVRPPFPGGRSFASAPVSPHRSQAAQRLSTLRVR